MDFTAGATIATTTATTSSSPSTSMSHHPHPPSYLLSSLFVFRNVLNQELIRSVHVYEVTEGEEERERERRVVVVEREFIFSPASCLEIRAPIPRPLLLVDPTAASGAGDRRWRFREGEAAGLWRCILAFDAADHSASSPVPPILSLSRNPRLKCLPTLAGDLEKVFQLRHKSENEQLLNFDLEEICVDKENQTDHLTEDALTSCEVQCSHSHPIVKQVKLMDQQSCGTQSETGQSMKKKKRAAAERVASIALSDLVKYFNLPITEASRNLNVGLTVLKRKCREFGIPRWPHRKIKSLDTLIHDLQEEVHQQEKENKAAAVKAATKRQRMLESEKEGIERSPFMELQGETKRFRQDVFKRRHRAKVLSKKCQQLFPEHHATTLTY